MHRLRLLIAVRIELLAAKFIPKLPKSRLALDCLLARNIPTKREVHLSVSASDRLLIDFVASLQFAAEVEQCFGGLVHRVKRVSAESALARR